MKSLSDYLNEARSRSREVKQRVPYAPATRSHRSAKAYKRHQKHRGLE